MGIAQDLATSLGIARGVRLPDDITGDDALESMRVLVTLRNVVDHLAAMVTGVLDRCAVAASQGRTLAGVVDVVGVCAECGGADGPGCRGAAAGADASAATLDRICCDTTVTTVIVDGEQVPLDMGRDKRLFPARLRKALYLRDQCCIKCGAPPGRTHAHHIVHWTHRGETSLSNGCLLCPGCHANVHHDGWDVVMGLDKHPWLIPPAAVDPHRKPIPAYNRRTMRLDVAA